MADTTVGGHQEAQVGFLKKSMKDMKTMVGAAPGMIEQANQMAAQAQQMQQAQQAQVAQMQAMQAGPTIPDGDPRLAPIAGVTLEQYAAISKAAATQGAAHVGSDDNSLVGLALARGVESAAAWQEAYGGWNARMQGDMQLATHFGHLYQAAS
jgi:uncharacterized membrane protein YdfJ with MMPL/SSD domain